VTDVLARMTVIVQMMQMWTDRAILWTDEEMRCTFQAKPYFDTDTGKQLRQSGGIAPYGKISQQTELSRTLWNFPRQVGGNCTVV